MCSCRLLKSQHQNRDPPCAIHHPDPDQRLCFADGLDIARRDIERRKRSGSTGAPGSRKRRARQHRGASERSSSGHTVCLG